MKNSQRANGEGGWEEIGDIQAIGALKIKVANTHTVSGYRIVGACGGLGIVGSGFRVTAGSSPLPVGTQIVINTTAGLSLGVLSTTQGLLDVTLNTTKKTVITLSKPLPANELIDISWIVNVPIGVTKEAEIILPEGLPGSAAKTRAKLEQSIFSPCKSS